MLSITAPLDSVNPRRYLKGDWGQFRQILTSSAIKDNVLRHGKTLIVELDTGWRWLIQLSSTGWFMPGNGKAMAACRLDPIHNKFLHPITEKTVRVKFYLTDGQVWLYHDARTWGKWFIEEIEEESKVLKGVGPDWLTNTQDAQKVLEACISRRTIKDVLTDQKLTAGLGNYLACEIAWRAHVHPHMRWVDLTVTDKARIAAVTMKFVELCLKSDDHRHWRVFDKAGDPCYVHHDKSIQYAKDGAGGKRGSYFCALCQPLEVE